MGAVRLRRVRLTILAASLALMSCAPILRMSGVNHIPDLAILASLALMTGYCTLLLLE